MGFPTSFGMGLHFSQKQKWLNGYQTEFSPVMEWSTDTKNDYDDYEVYIEYRYVFVSLTGRNHAKMAAFSGCQTFKNLCFLLGIPVFTTCGAPHRECIAGTLDCVFIDNETHESGVTKCTTGEAWSAFSWHHSSVFHCQWTHNQVFLLLSHMLI